MTPWTAAPQASLSFTIFPKLAQTHVHWVSDAIQPSSPRLLLPQSFPASGSFPVNQLFTSDGQSLGTLASASVLQWVFRVDFPSDWLVWSCCPQDFQESFPAPQFKASILWHSVFLIVQLAHPFVTTGKTIALARWTFVGKVMSLLFKTLSRFVIVFPPRSNHLLISWLGSPSIVILEPKKRKSVTTSTFSPSVCHKVRDRTPWS